MPKRKLPSVVQTVDTLFQDIKGEDILIMAGGFIAGTQGYTPISALISIAGESPSAKIKSARDTAASKLSGGELAQANSFLGALDFINVVGAFLPSGFLGQQAAGYGASQLEEQINTMVPADPEKQKQVRDYVMSTLAMGCVGMIEAYAYTRPGTLAGIGEIVKGIGEMIPG